MNKKIIICLILISLLASSVTVNAYSNNLDFTAKNQETYSTYTDYPATLKYFLKEDNAGEGWKTPYIMSLVNSIIKDSKTDYEKASKIFDWVCSNLEYDISKEDPDYDGNRLNTILTRGVKYESVEYPYVLISFLRAAGIPSRAETMRPAGIFVFVTAYTDGRWIIMDPCAGVLENYLNDSFGNDNFVNTSFDIPLEKSGNLHLNNFMVMYSTSNFENYIKTPIIEIPEGYTEIGYMEFFNDMFINKVTFPKTIEKIGFFSNAENLKNIVIPKDSDLETIDDNAFYQCISLEEVILSDNVKEIGYSAFAGCQNLKRIYIPPSVNIIRDNTFSPIEYNNFKYDTEKKNLVTVVTKYEMNDLLIIGEEDSYAHKYATKNKINFQPTLEIATPTNSIVFVNNSSVAFEAYNIDGNNYFKLRDLAEALKHSSKNFDVQWDDLNKAIKLISNKNYVSVGGELEKGDNNKKTYVKSNNKINIDNEQVDLMAYNIGGNNYFKLRDITKSFNIGLIYNEKTKEIIIDTSIDY